MSSIGNIMRIPKRRKLARHLRNFFETEASGGIIMIACALLAVFLANGDSPEEYFTLVSTPLSLGIGEFSFSNPISWWIENVAMSFFFLLIGLELKREIMEGELSSKSLLVLPLASAISGIAVPAIIYITLNRNNPDTLSGWAIPAVTDIAFAICVLMMITRVPPALKIFLLTLAILNDLFAVTVIAFLNSGDLNMIWLLTGISICLILFFMNRAGVYHFGLFFFVGAALWLCLYNGGIHPSIAGSLIACFVPMGIDGTETSPLKRMGGSIHSWTAYLILPMFAFIAAGVDFDGIALTSLLEPMPLGIITGLFFGRQLGVFGAFYLVVKTGLAKMPDNVTWPQVYGIAILTGIGFTMSLFISDLALTSSKVLSSVKMAIAIGSLMSALLGYVILVFSCRYHSARSTSEETGNI